ncbi:MAG: hypothetical protein LBB79_04050 [Prevotellaceae bacterium]|jgi:hypothetical protein|nr:hypothetical protein [Prevotellaceae bacterium]
MQKLPRSCGLAICRRWGQKGKIKREGGQILILSPKSGLAAALSALPLDKTFSENKNSTLIRINKKIPQNIINPTSSEAFKQQKK